jgi:hypothetical protein
MNQAPDGVGGNKASTALNVADLMINSTQFEALSWLEMS